MTGQILSSAAVLAIAPAFAVTLAFVIITNIVADLRRDGELF